jgi:hypothetical protein
MVDAVIQQTNKQLEEGKCYVETTNGLPRHGQYVDISIFLMTKPTTHKLDKCNQFMQRVTQSKVSNLF